MSAARVALVALALASFGARAQIVVPAEPAFTIRSGALSPTNPTVNGSLILDATNTLCSQALSMTWSGDLNTGVQHSAADVFVLCAGGVANAQILNGGFLVPTGAPGGQVGLGFIGASSMTGLTLISATRIGMYFTTEGFDFDSTFGLTDIPGAFAYVERAAPSMFASEGVCYADSTTHSIMCSENADAFSVVQREVATITSADTTNITNTLADVTGATIALPVGTWLCSADGEATNTTSGEGLQVNWQFSGTATTGSGSWSIDTTAPVFTDCSQTAGSSLTCAVATFAAGSVHASMRFVVTVAGTLKLQAAENGAHVSGTEKVFKGTVLACESLR